jgi:hypothetical protein
MADLYMRIRTGVPREPKFVASTPEANWFWLCGIAYCRESSHDGRLPRVIVPTLCPGVSPRRAMAAAEKLVEVALWDRDGQDYRVHDYNVWNPTKAEIDEFKKKDRDRKRPPGIQMESDRNPNGSDQAFPDGIQAPTRGRAPAAASSPSPFPNPVASEALAEESARETARPLQSRVVHGLVPHRGYSLIGDDTRHQRSCPPMTWGACARGLCVPTTLHADWMRQLCLDGTLPSAAEQVIGSMVDRAVERLAPGPVGDRPYDFWRAVWSDEHPSQAPVKPAASTRRESTTEQAIRAGREGL